MINTSGTISLSDENINFSLMKISATCTWFINVFVCIDHTMHDAPLKVNHVLLNNFFNLQLAADSFRDDLSPPPLLPRSVPATSPLTIHTIAPSSESSETSMSDVDPRKSISSVSPDPEGGGGSMRESPDLGAASGEELIPGAGGVGGGGRDSREKRVSSLALSSPEPSNGICSITEEQEPEVRYSDYCTTCTISHIRN